MDNRPFVFIDIRASLLHFRETLFFFPLRNITFCPFEIRGAPWPFRPARHMIESGSWRRGSIGAKHSRKPSPPAQLQLTILAYQFPRVNRQGVHFSGFGRTHGKWKVRLRGYTPPAAKEILCVPQGTFCGCKSRVSSVKMSLVVLFTNVAGLGGSYDDQSA